MVTRTLSPGEATDFVVEGPSWVRRAVEGLDVAIISETALPGLDDFFNVDTPEALQAAAIRFRTAHAAAPVRVIDRHVTIPATEN